MLLKAISKAMSNSNTSCINSGDNLDYHSIPKDSRRKTLASNDAINSPIRKNNWSQCNTSNSITVPVTNLSRTNSSLSVSGSINADKLEFWNVTNHSELNCQVTKKDLFDSSQTINNDRASLSCSGLKNTSSVKIRFHYENGIACFFLVLLNSFASLSARLDFKRGKIDKGKTECSIRA